MRFSRVLNLRAYGFLLVGSFAATFLLLMIRWPNLFQEAVLAIPGICAISFAVAEISSNHGLQLGSLSINRILVGIIESRLGFSLNTLLMNAVDWRDTSRAECYPSAPNADIVGSGVRWSIYVLLLFVFLSLFLASFHEQPSGTKELGCTVLISKSLLPVFI